MTAFLVAIISIFLTILLVIGIHELGHFLAARWLGVKVLRFSIGFGKSLFRIHDKKGTEYIFAMIPLGGYVKLLDETEGPVPQNELHLAFNRQPFYKKFLIAIAGVAFNFLFAFLIYWFLFVIGFTSPRSIIGEVTPHSIAANAGIKSQTEILKIDHYPTKEWMSIIVRLLSHVGDQNKMTITTQDLTHQTPTVHVLDLKDWKIDDLKPNPLESLGIIPYQPDIPAVIGEIDEKSTAFGSLKKGDKVLALNNQKISDWATLSHRIALSPDERLTFLIQRAGKTMNVSVQNSHTRTIFLKKRGFLGLKSDWHWPSSLLTYYQYSPIPALHHAYLTTQEFIILNFLVLKKLLTGKIALASLGGPISIFEGAGTSLNAGIIPFLSFVAFLSISIGFVNLLPIPGLDGGLILFQFIEWIYRPISLRAQNLFFRLGLIFLLLLMTQALVNDILRL